MTELEIEIETRELQLAARIKRLLHNIKRLTEERDYWKGEYMKLMEKRIQETEV